MKVSVVLAILFLIFINCNEPGKPSFQKLQSASLFKGNELKQEIPILCYHNFTEDKNTVITLSRSRFEEQIKSLSDSGYHTILPDELYDYLTISKPLPPKSIMITFDDTRGAQYTIAKPILEKYGFKGVFFIMTVCVDKKDYMSSTQLKELSDKGNVIGCHTYDHPLVSSIKNSEWKRELQQPKFFLEKIIQKPVNYFAYPFGTCTKTAISELKHYQYKAAFQLSGKQSLTDSLFSIRRLLVHGTWPAPVLNKMILKTFPSVSTEKIMIASR